MPTHNQDQSPALPSPESVASFSTMHTADIEPRLDEAPSNPDRPSNQFLDVPVTASFRSALKQSGSSLASHSAVPYDNIYASEGSNTDISSHEAADETFAEETDTALSDQDEHQLLGRTGQVEWSERNEASASESLLSAERESTGIPSRGSTEKEYPARKYWQPFCLRREVLLSLSATFLMCLLGTALLYSISQKNKGIRTEDESRHYVWKYGPTAVLTVILYLWYSIDLSIRSLLPWQELQRGPRPAELTLLLDYISPILTTSLWRAMKNRHWAVVLAIIGRYLILLAIAFSTALLVLEPTEVVVTNVPLTAPKFSAKSFQLDNVSPFAADMYYGINFGNLSAPLGTFPDTYIPPPMIHKDNKTGSIPPDAKLNATIPGIRFDAACDVLDIANSETILNTGSVSSKGDVSYRLVLVNVTTPSCRIKEAIAGRKLEIDIENPSGTVFDYQAMIGEYMCNIEKSYYQIFEQSILAPDATLGNSYANQSNVTWTNTTTDHRILLTISDISASEFGDSVTAHNVTALLCKPSYMVTDYHVLYDMDSQTVQMRAIEGAKEAHVDVPGFPQGALGSAVLRAVGQVNLLDRKGDGEKHIFGEYESPPFIGLMKIQSNASTISQFQKADLLRDTFVNVFKGVATQLAPHMLLNQSDQLSVTSTATFTQERLKVTKLSTIIMCAAFGTLAIISAALGFMTPRNIIFSDPGPVLAMATSIEYSQDTVEILRGLGHLRDRTIQGTLDRFHFASTVSQAEGKLMITTAPPRGASGTSAAALKTELRWWRPLGTQSWFLFVSFAVPLVLVGLLEVFQRRSDRNNGFVKIQSQEGQLMANYIPSIISILIGAMFSSIVAACSTFTPFSGLVTQPTQLSRSIALNYVTQAGPRLGYTSLTNTHPGLSIITLAQLISSVLTIVLSGLYSAIEVPFSSDIMLQQLDRIEINDTIPTWGPRAGTMTKLNMYYGLEFPNWTYDSIAMPRISVADESALNSFNNVSITGVLPGVRGRLNCTSVPSQNFEMSFSDYSKDSPRSFQSSDPEADTYVPESDMNIIFTLNGRLAPDTICETSTDDKPRLAYHEEFYVRNGSKPTFFGRASRIYATDWRSSPDSADPRPRGCPTLAVVLGQVTARQPDNGTTYWSQEPGANHETSTDSDFGVLFCWPKFDEFNVTAALSWPLLKIATDIPPVIDQSSIREINNRMTGESTWDFEWISPLEDFWESLRNTNDVHTYYGLVQANTSFDAFILALISGKYMVPLEDISGENNTGALLQSVQSLWGRYMAQSISQNMRFDIDSASPPASNSHPSWNTSPQPSTGTTKSQGPMYSAKVEAIYPDSVRNLRQNASSKIALQVMLGVMSLSVVLMHLLTRFDKVLPHNPCSIAGTISLILDGNLMDMPMAKPTKYTRNPSRYKRYMRLRRHLGTEEESLESEQRFVMGWWNDGGTRKFGIRYAEDTEET